MTENKKDITPLESEQAVKIVKLKEEIKELKSLKILLEAQNESNYEDNLQLERINHEQFKKIVELEKELGEYKDKLHKTQRLLADVTIDDQSALSLLNRAEAVEKALAEAATDINGGYQ